MSKITENDKQLYAKCMELIKKRISAIDDFLQDKKTTTFPQTNREFLYLQFRFVFESIALAALCSHRHHYKKINTQFRKEWNASIIIKKIKKINQYYFPLAVLDCFGTMNSPGTVEFIQEGVLTEEDLIKGIGVCGDNLHQYNPYKGYIDIDAVQEKERFMQWRNKIVKLLNTHWVSLHAEDKVLRVVMNTLPEGDVTIQELERNRKQILPQ